MSIKVLHAKRFRIQLISFFPDANYQTQDKNNSVSFAIFFSLSTVIRWPHFNWTRLWADAIHGVSTFQIDFDGNLVILIVKWQEPRGVNQEQQLKRKKFTINWKRKKQLHSKLIWLMQNNGNFICLMQDFNVCRLMIQNGRKWNFTRNIIVICMKAILPPNSIFPKQ